MTATRVLVVDDEESLRHMLSLALSKDGYHVWTAGSGAEALEMLKSHEPFDICLTDVRMPGMDGLTFIETGAGLKDRAPTFIAMSAYGDEKLAVEALRRGAFDYVSKPFEPDEISLKLRLVVEKRQMSEAQTVTDDPNQNRPRHKQPGGLGDVIAVSSSMASVFKIVRKVANFPTTVLLTGETGTGKERIAGSIHHEGNRSSRPFVAINCGAIPENLLESELFGYVKGAFTDAQQDREGLFEVANAGTLFLDEIAELPVQLQVKLLRALVEKEIRRVGDTKTIPVDVRVIAATARDLDALVKRGAFREDLYYRLNVVSIRLPPLRDRPDDIPVLVEHFVRFVSARLGLPNPTITDEAMKILAGYNWPGNVRELENAIERALVLSEGDGRITAVDLDDRFDQTPERGAVRGISIPQGELSLKIVLPRVERILIERALEKTGGNRTKASTLLGISHRALLYKLKEHGIT